MLYSKVINLISKHLGDDLVSAAEMLGYIARVIDDINIQLDTCFPTFTEAQETYGNDNTDYIAFPDKYIRTVVVPGAAFKYYVTDEEGNQAAVKYEEDYRQGLFYMLRDYSSQIPAEYRNVDGGGVNISDLTYSLDVPFRGGMW
jgi:hypothetical protein